LLTLCLIQELLLDDQFSTSSGFLMVVLRTLHYF
ncbi:MAG: hypothetical protein C75L2_00800024, partial [Leptospirillum sp. Group II 'C75']